MREPIGSIRLGADVAEGRRSSSGLAAPHPELLQQRFRPRVNSPFGAASGPPIQTLDDFGAPLTVPLLSQSRCCRLGDIVTKGRKQRVREFKALKGDAARSRILVDSSGVLHSGEPILAYVHSGVANTTFRPAQNQPQLTPDASGTYCTDELARAVLAAARPPHYALARRPSKKTINQPDRSQFKLLDNTSGSQFKLLDNTSGSQFKLLIDTSGSQFKLLDNTGGSQTSCKQESVQAARRQGGVCSSRKASRRSLFKPQGAKRSLFKPQGLQGESVQAAGRREESVQAARPPGGVTLIYPQRAAKTHGSVALSVTSYYPCAGFGPILVLLVGGRGSREAQPPYGANGALLVIRVIRFDRFSAGGRWDSFSPPLDRIWAKGNPDPSKAPSFGPSRSWLAAYPGPAFRHSHPRQAAYERWQPARGSVPPDETFERARLCESGFDALR
ncbi:hypothetical protein PG987_013908 [Apiospora arundinis]